MTKTTKTSTRSGSSGRRKQYSAPALEKGLDILELLSGEEKGMNISELAKSLGRTVGEVFRMMAVLEQREYIRLKEGSDTYHITLKMFSLSHKFPPLARLSTAAVPVMKLLAQQSHQSCHLSIYYNGRGHVVFQQDAPTDRIFTVRLGAEAPLMDTCSGRVLLAFADEARRDMMVEDIPDHQRKPDEGEVAKLVKRLQKQGYERLKSAQVQGVHDIGYPVFDQYGQITATLVVPYVAYGDTSNAVSLDDVTEFAGQAAAKISATLGYSGS